MVYGLGLFDNEVDLNAFKALYVNESKVSIVVCIHLTEEQIKAKIAESGDRRAVFLVITTDEKIKKMLIRKSATASKHWLNERQALQSQVLKAYDWSKYEITIK